MSPAAKAPSVLDATSLTLAGTYAEGLLGAADETGADPRELAGELHAVVECVYAMDEREWLLPGPDRARQVAMIEAVFAGRVSDLLAGFLVVLARRGRLAVLALAAAELQTLIDRRYGRVGVEVTSAVPLTDEQTRRIETRLRQVMQAEPAVRFRVEAAILGGLKMQVADTVYDATVAGDIHRLAEHILRGVAREPTRDEANEP